jgi:hypothetical protein
MSGLFGGHGGSGSITLVDGGEGGAGGSSGTGAGAGGGSAEDAGPNAQLEGAGEDAGADAGPAIDPECEGIEFPEPDCRCAGFEMRAYVFCPGPVDSEGSIDACSSVEGFDLFGYDQISGMVTRTLEEQMALAQFVEGLSGGVAVWRAKGNPLVCWVQPGAQSDVGDVVAVSCSEPHAYICEQRL